MKRSLLLALSIAAVFIFSCSKPQAEYAMVSFIVGDVTVNEKPCKMGDLINEKDLIATGVDSSCDIKLGSSIIRVKEKTKLTISTLIKTGNMENTTLDLAVGKMLCKPKKLLKSESFLVKTPTAVAGVRGTQFTIETDKFLTTRVKVYDGKVKVTKRVMVLEDKLDEILESATTLAAEEKVIITKKDADAAEKIVKDILNNNGGKATEQAIDKAVEKAKKDILISKNDVEKFSAEDYKKDNKEIIAIEMKPQEVIKKIETVIKEEKKEPKPNGRLLVTRYEVYFIKNGRVLWEGKVVEEPVRQNDKLYIASGEYVFCASVDGPVFWRKKIENEGRLLIREDKLIVTSKGTESALDLLTGQNL